MMLSKLTALFHQAAEFSSQILTTDATSQDEFRQHWKTVTDIITDNGSVFTLKEKLEVMLELLCREEGANPTDPGTVGPCLEFVLRHKILDILFTAAKNDYPCGMARQVLVFFTNLLDQLERPLLHHVCIHQPISLQVTCCGEDPSGLLSTDEVCFIEAICRRLKKDPRLADLFMKCDHNQRKEFVLLQALLRLGNSSNTHVVIKSYESLLTCASLQHSSVTKSLINGHLPMMLASKLQYHFQLIPPNTKYTIILSGLSDQSPANKVNICPSLSSPCHLTSLFSWLTYCEQIISVSQPALGMALCHNIHEVFLTASLLPRLLKSREEDILISTTILASAIKVISCRMLLEEFVVFCLKTILSLTDETDVTKGTFLLEKLIYRIDHVNEDVCRVTLHFFDILLHSPFHNMVIEHLTDCESIANLHTLQAEVMHSIRIQLEEDTISYLSLIPDCFSSYHDVGSEDLKLYFQEAHNKIARIHEECFPIVSCYPAETRTKSLFLHTLLNKLETLLDQPYEINLLVTSLFNQLAAAPYPTAKWLFATRTQTRNVYSVLKKIADTFQSRIDRTPGLLVQIIEARRRLEGQPTSDLLSMPHNDLLEGAVVLDEFIKELCSTLYAKTSWCIISLPAPLA